MFKTLLVVFFISIFVVAYFSNSSGVAIFTVAYFLFAIVIYLLKYVFSPNKDREYTSYISDLWRRVFNRFYVCIMLFSPVLFVFSQRYSTLKSEIEAYSLVLMSLFFIGLIVFIFRVILKTIILVFKRFIYGIDPNSRY